MICRTVHLNINLVKLVLIVCLFVGATAAQALSARAASRAPDANTVLLAAASPFEDMTEFALQGDQDGIDRALQAYSTQSARVDRILPPPLRTQLHARTAAIAKAHRATDHAGVAINAVEAYGLLVQALRPEQLKVPVEVANLDYAGFKLKVLMHGSTKDWPAARALSRQARTDWSAIQARVTDKGLQDAMNVTIDGMQQATRQWRNGRARRRSRSSAGRSAGNLLRVCAEVSR